VDNIVAAANLLAFVFGLEQTRCRADVAKMATDVVVAKFVPRADVKIAETDDEENENRRNVTISTYAVQPNLSLT